MFTKIKNFLGKMPKKARSFVIGMLAMGMLMPAVLPGLASADIAPPVGPPHFNDNPGELHDTYMVDNRTQDPNNYGKTKVVAPGDIVSLRVYIHNDQPNSVARDTNVSATLDTQNYVQRFSSTGTIYSADAVPSSVSDSVTITANEPVRLQYIDGSTRHYWYDLDGTEHYEVKPDTVLDGGVNIGNVQGCWEYVRYVIFRVEVQAEPVQPADLDITKNVRNTESQTLFADQTNAEHGDRMEFVIRSSNTGGENANEVRVRDVLPSGLEYVANTTRIRRGQLETPVNDSQDSLFDADGVMVGMIEPDQYAEVLFMADVDNSAAGTLTNTGYTSASGIVEISDTARVVVEAPGEPVLAIAKTVGVGEDTISFSENVEVNEGDVVRFHLDIGNTGGATASEVMVQDVLPSGLEYIDGSTERWDVTGNSDVSDDIVGDGASLGDLVAPTDADGAVYNVDVYFNATVTATTAGVLTNTGRTWATSLDPVEDTATVSVEDEPTDPNLNVEKMVSLGEDSNNFEESVEAEEDGIVRYRVVVSNTGGSTAQNVVLTDELPNGLEYTGEVSPDTYDIDDLESPGLELGDLDPDEEVTVYFHARVTTNDEETLVNVATADADNADPDEDRAEVLANRDNDATLDIQKTVARGENSRNFYESVEAYEDDIVRFRLIVENDGDNVADDVEIWDELPSGLNYVSNSTIVDDEDWDDDDGVVTSSGIGVGDLDLGEEVEVVFNARVTENDERDLANFGFAAATNAREVDDEATVEVKVNGGDDPYLSIEKSVDDSSVEPGQEIRYTIRVENTGDGDATDVTITDRLPSRIRAYEDTLDINSDGRVEDDDLWGDGVVVDRLEPGETVVIRYDARVDSDATPGADYENTAVARDDEGDRAEDEAVVTVRDDQAYLSITKEVNKTSAATGDRLKYTITVTNTGDEDATNVRITDDFPIRYLEYIEDSMEIDGRYITEDDQYELFDSSGIRASRLRPDEEIVITFEAEVLKNVNNGTVIDNEAEARADGGLRDDDIATTRIQGGNVQEPSVELIKLVKNITKNDASYSTSTTANPGNVVEYKVTLTNNGDETLSNVRLYDSLPADMNYLGGTAKVWLNGAELGGDWNGLVESNGIGLPELKPGDVISVYFQVKSKTSIADNTTLVNTIRTSIPAMTDIDKSASASVRFETEDVPVPGPKNLPDTGTETAVGVFMFIGLSSLAWFIKEKLMLARMM
ncbi:DUF11 domain-containing protein [Patescibacteria group bacterium]|nr:DUF11 domain-containing protein [Patescibacteria group bacterium]